MIRSRGFSKQSISLFRQFRAIWHRLAFEGAALCRESARTCHSVTADLGTIQIQNAAPAARQTIPQAVRQWCDAALSHQAKTSSCRAVVQRRPLHHPCQATFMLTLYFSRFRYASIACIFTSAAHRNAFGQGLPSHSPNRSSPHATFYGACTQREFTLSACLLDFLRHQTIFCTSC